MPDTIVITGGAGFVGSNLATRFKQDNPAARIVALDNLARRGSELNAERIQRLGIEFVQADVRRPQSFADVGGADLVIDCAAEPSVLKGYNDPPADTIDTKLFGTVNTLEYARGQGAALVFLSTSRVYPVAPLRGLAYRELQQRVEPDHDKSPPGVSARGLSEAFDLWGARTLYGATKLASELLLIEYCDGYNLPCVINRCGVLCGPWQMGRIDQGLAALWVAHH